MRVLQRYRFLVGTKIPFDKWPDIIEEFLRSQGLSHRVFHYCLETYDVSDRCRAVLDGTNCKICGAPEYACEQCRKEAASTLRKGTGCERAIKEHPFLGQIEIRQTQFSTIQSLNNFSDESNGIKEDIYSIIPKIYRRYGFAHTSLIYRDIDFFSRRIPAPAPTTANADYLINGYDGSGITLHRSCISNDNAIILTVEAHYPGEVPDATPYADALGKLLPGIKRQSATTIIMKEDEQLYYQKIHQSAQSFVTQARDFFVGRMPEEKGNNDPDAPANVAFYLKKLSKRFGYSYRGYNYYVYCLEKRLANGHYLCLEFVSNPMCPTADPYVKLCGLGFEHDIWADAFGPQNPRDASEYLTHLFHVLEEAECWAFPAILDLYPPTPEWFMPTP